MSRAFVKEAEDRFEESPRRLPASSQPYYVTPSGKRQLREKLDAARREGDAARIDDLATRLENAIVIDPALHKGDDVAFGAQVTVEDPSHKTQTYRIVGEDEADPIHGSISWRSPLADALIDHHEGEKVTWKRPVGNLQLRIVRVEYG